MDEKICLHSLKQARETYANQIARACLKLGTLKSKALKIWYLQPTNNAFNNFIVQEIIFLQEITKGNQ